MEALLAELEEKLEAVRQGEVAPKPSSDTWLGVSFCPDSAWR
jgi:hypothetical protein